MKKQILQTLLALGMIFTAATGGAVPIHVTHLWHMHQPIYYPYESVTATDNLGVFNFNIAGEVWDGDRYNCYRNWPANAVGMASGHGGSQMSYSGSLVENNNVLWGHATTGNAGWAANIRNARNNVRTSKGNPRLDIVGIAYHHSLMPLTCVESMRMQIRLHREQYQEVWNTGEYSKGFWPPECAFDSSMIPALVAEGLEWVIVDNGHLFRTVSDFEWSSASSCRPNKADVRNGSSANLASSWVQLPNVWAPTKVLAPWSYQPHYTRYVNPDSGAIQKIIAVPAGRYEGNENGRGGYGAFKPENVWGGNIAANNNASKPMLLLCHSDGDNYGMKNADAWNGQQQLFINMAASNPDFEYTSAQDYLDLYPPDVNDVIHVEAGSWIGIDGGTPYYEKWLSYEDRDGEMPDMWSWSVLVAAQNRVLTADDMENSYLNLSGGRTMDDVEWALNNDTARAWHYYLNGETSCYWYWDYDRANPWDGNVTRACNLANGYAANVINRYPNGDTRGPSIFPPQRTPYNPGGKMWDEAEPLASDFKVWTFVDDVSGVASATLYWRKDNDGLWPINSTENETYAGGPGVGAWQAVNMTADWWPSNPGPKVPGTVSARAQRYMATISGQSECLIDYFVEAVDSRGNTNRSNILHVWVGEQSGGTGDPDPSPVWVRSTHPYPAAGEATAASTIYINTEAGPAASVTSVTLGYTTDNGSTWQNTNMTINLDWTSASGGAWYNCELGSFPADTVLEYYIEATDGVSTNWDNNGGVNYTLNILSASIATDVRFTSVFSTPAEPIIGGSVTITAVMAAEGLVDLGNLDVWLGYAINPEPGAAWPTHLMTHMGSVTNTSASSTNIMATFSHVLSDLPAGALIKYYFAASLDAGAHMIYENNNSQDYTIQMPAWPIVPDGLQITIPSNAYTTVGYSPVTVSGTAGSDLGGDIRWTNALTGASGTLALTPTWNTPVTLAYGTNAFTVSADRLPGSSSITNAQDAASNYNGDYDGLDSGTGFGTWTINKVVDNGWSWTDTNGFGLATTFSNSIMASRPLDAALAVGDTFSVYFKNGDVAFPADGISPGVGFGLCNQTNLWDNIWGFWFNGGDEHYSMTGNPTTIGWSPSGFQIDFTLTSATTYSVDITPVGSETATFTGPVEGVIDAFRFWNWSSKGEEYVEGVKVNDFDLFIDHPTVISSTTIPGGTSSQTVYIIYTPDGNARMLLDDATSPAHFTDTTFTFKATDGYAVSQVMYATNLTTDAQSNTVWDLRFPTTFTNNPDGTFSVDIPPNVSLAIFGVTFTDGN